MCVKKIFVCEFITAGGFNHVDLPESLVCEGAMMRDALLRDLAKLPYRVETTLDARLEPPKDCHVTAISAHDDVWQVWERLIIEADAVWLIAPETDGFLAKLTQLAVTHNKKIVGCGLQSIEVTSSKLATFHALTRVGIDTIPTYTLENWPKNAGTWLAKPNDGAGCDETVCFDNAEDLAGWLSTNNKANSHIIQPYQIGQPASISCVMYAGKAQILSCNKQLIEINNHQLSYHGSIVNGMCEHWMAFELVANKIAHALQDLAGYVGIDVIVSEGKTIVVEINPRLTTSYCALAQAAGVNPAELIINTLTQENFIWPKLAQNSVELHV